MNTRRMMQLAAKIGGHLKEFEEIDLIKSDGDDCCYPSWRSGPTLYISGRKDSKVFDLPKEGKATVSYRIRSKSVHYDREGGESYSTDVEIQTIDAKKITNFSTMIDKYVELADGRARDAGGRYADGDAPPSPQDIAAAYGPAQKKKRRAIGIGAGLAAVAGTAAVPGARAGAAKLGGAALRTIAGLR